MHRTATLIAWAALFGVCPALAQDPPPAPSLLPPAEDSRAATIDSRYDQAERLIRQIDRLNDGPEKSVAVEELRNVLAQMNATYSDEEKADHARRTIDALRAEIERQRSRLKQSGIAMAQAKNADPPDLTAIHTAGSEYTLQEAVLKALEEKAKHEARRQSMGTSEAMRLMQEVE